MRHLLLSGFLFLSFIVSSQENSIDVLHYKFKIDLTDAHDTIFGIAEITVRFLQPADQVSFDLDLLNADGSGMAIGKPAGDFVKRINNQADKITLVFSKPVPAGDTITLSIPYQGIPGDGLIISRTKFGRRSFFADNWPDRAHFWFPCHDHPADKASVEFIVQAPEHYQVVSNGIQLEETSIGRGQKLTHWKEDIPISTKVMTLGVADFAVNLAGYVNDCIPVYSWVYPENKEDGFYDFAQAKEILPFFIDRVGPYGYKKLANVQSRTRFGGLENANTIFYSENLITGTRTTEGIVTHELAHQWFGNMATEKSFAHLWLSEGFATYFTILYFENKYGRDTAIGMLKEDREQVIDFSAGNNKAVVNLTETDYMKLLNRNSYEKGGWVLHMLRRELGDSVFWRSIRRYYAWYAGKVAGTEDLQKIFEEISGKDLKQFFHQWLFIPGQPDLDINWKYDARNKKLIFNIIQKQKESFQFPLELLISFSSGASRSEKMVIDKQTNSFSFSCEEKPLRIIADPETALLFSGKTREVK